MVVYAVKILVGQHFVERDVYSFPILKLDRIILKFCNFQLMDILITNKECTSFKQVQTNCLAFSW